LALRRQKRLDHLNQPYNIRIERWRLFRGNPRLRVHGTPNRLPKELSQILSPHRKPGHDTRRARFDISVARDLRRIRMIRDRIKDRLTGKPRRKFLKFRVLDELQLFKANRAI
jgi:hypothetical protein